jgi:hypothetical protein
MSGGDGGIMTCYGRTSMGYRLRSRSKPNPGRRYYLYPVQSTRPGLSRIWLERGSGINQGGRLNLWHIPWSLRSPFSGGGDYRELGESSTHPKSINTTGAPRMLEADTKQEITRKDRMETKHMLSEGEDSKGERGVDQAMGKNRTSDEEKNWAMEVYRGDQDRVHDEVSE